MIRSVGPLLLGLGLCVASGCASAGAGRGFHLADRMPWSRSRAAATASSVDVNGAASTGHVKFRTPQREPRSAPIANRGDTSFTGHSPDLNQASRSATSGAETGSPIIRAGHQAEPSETLSNSDDGSGNAKDGATASRVIDAQFRSDRDDADNPVQLQGLQAIDASGEPTQALRPNVASPVSSAELDTTGAVPERHVQIAGAQDSVVSPGPWQSDLDRLIAKAERELAGMSPGTTPAAQAEYRRQQVHLRLLYLAARHPEQALTAIPSLEPADQEYWQQIVWAITNSVDAEEQLSSRERAAHTIPPVNTALRRLREQADLTIRNAAFCEEISYFGNYKRFPTDEFVPGQPVLLYAEIENFRSEPSPTGEYRTLLKSLIEIIGPGGQVRGWKKSFAATEDLCRNPRRDYFHNYQFTIPERLPLGPHTLKLTVVDELSGKQATSAIKFVVK